MLEKNQIIISLLIITTFGIITFSDSEEGEPSTYISRFIQGWTVQLNERLLTEEKELGRRVLDLLDVKLYDINRAVPEKALKALHQVSIWVDVKARQFPCAVYHPSPRWLEEHGFDPKKARSVHIANATNFLRWTHEQPAMVLHELAHAYHHQVLGYDCEAIRNAYQQAKESKTYESVLRYNGEMQRAYALNNDQEYFAELSEAYFGTNDFYPFVRAEIMRHDPGGLDMLERVWGISTEGKK